MQQMDALPVLVHCTAQCTHTSDELLFIFIIIVDQLFFRFLFSLFHFTHTHTFCSEFVSTAGLRLRPICLTRSDEMERCAIVILCSSVNCVTHTTQRTAYEWLHLIPYWWWRNKWSDFIMTYYALQLLQCTRATRLWLMVHTHSFESSLSFRQGQMTIKFTFAYLLLRMAYAGAVHTFRWR